MERQPFLTHCFALIICRNSEGKWLCVKETNNRGWWVAGGLVEPKENFYEAAIRETKEEAGVDIIIKGILRVEHSVIGYQTARMRVIFFAVSETITPKQYSDKQSEGAAWLTTKEIINISKSKPGLRGYEILEWPMYIEKGGLIAPINFFSNEDESVTYIKDINIYNDKLKLEDLSKEEQRKIFINYLENEDFNNAKALIKNGLNPDTYINQKNWTALHYAIKFNNIDFAKFLLLSGASANSLTHKNRNCFHFAAQTSLAFIKLLLFSISEMKDKDKYLTVNKQDIYGDTPLHILGEMILNNYLKIDFNYLIAEGFDPNIKNKNGISFLDMIQKSVK